MKKLVMVLVVFMLVVVFVQAQNVEAAKDSVDYSITGDTSYVSDVFTNADWKTLCIEFGTVEEPAYKLGLEDEVYQILYRKNCESRYLKSYVYTYQALLQIKLISRDLGYSMFIDPTPEMIADQKARENRANLQFEQQVKELKKYQYELLKRLKEGK